MPVALILVDALSASYPAGGSLPAVAEIARGGLASPLENIYAYRGIEATLFTGRAPAEHGVWGEFRPRSEPHRGGPLGDLCRSLIAAGDLLPSDRLRLDVRYIAAKLQRTAHLPTGNLIPPSLMPLFQGSVESDIWSPECLPVPTLFDELRAEGLSFENVVYPTIRRDDEAVPRVRQRVLKPDLPDFWYIKFSALDVLGHKYGPRPEKMRGALKELDAQVAELTSVLRGTYGDSLEIVLLSDHGMSAVTRTIDVRPHLARASLKAGRDYLYFLDSTTLRFWSDSPRNIEVLRSIFGNVAGMSVVDEVERVALGIPNDESTGNLLVALDEGVVVFPDFFRASGAPLGMHGYARVESHAGLPYLAVGERMARLMDHPPGLTGHAAVWSAMRRSLGLARAEENRVPAMSVLEGTVACTC